MSCLDDQSTVAVVLTIADLNYPDSMSLKDIYAISSNHRLDYGNRGFRSQLLINCIFHFFIVLRVV
jgi:hypothetical protein